MSTLTKSGFMWMNEKPVFLSSIFSFFLVPISHFFAYIRTHPISVVSAFVALSQISQLVFFRFFQFFSISKPENLSYFQSFKQIFISIFLFSFFFVLEFFGFIFSNSFFLFFFFPIFFLFSFLQRRNNNYLSGVLKVSAGPLPTVFFTSKKYLHRGCFLFV